METLLSRAKHRKDALGRIARAFFYLKKRGLRKTLRKIWLLLRLKFSEKKYLRGLELSDAETATQQKTVFPGNIRFSLLVPLYNTPLDFLKEMIGSVVNQTYANWELCLADGSDEAHTEDRTYCEALSREDSRILYRKLEKNGGISENTNACLEMATGDYIALFDHDDLLEPFALYEVMKAICEQGADFIYSDEMVFASPNPKKIIASHFKPDFSPDSLLSNNYICHFTVFSRELLKKTEPFRKAYDGSQDHDIILRLTSVAEKVAHVPKVLYLWRSSPSSVASDISSKTYAIEAGRSAVRDFLKSGGIDAEVTSTEIYPTMYHVRYPVEGIPTVVALIRDRSQAERLRETVLKSGNPYISGAEIIHENGEGLAAAFDREVRKTNADYLLFVDGELEPLMENWIEELLMLASRKEVGAVGGKVSCGDDSIRQAGLVLRLGAERLVGRCHFETERDSSGYFGQLAIVGNMSAVSAECLMISREKYLAAGGFSGDYRNSLFDVDLCLKLNKAGYRNLYTPFAELQGGSSARFREDYGYEETTYRQDADLFRKNWSSELSEPDPYYNPNLSLDFADYRIG